MEIPDGACQRPAVLILELEPELERLYCWKAGLGCSSALFSVRRLIALTLATAAQTLPSHQPAARSSVNFVLKVPRRCEGRSVRGRRLTAVKDSVRALSSLASCSHRVPDEPPSSHDLSSYERPG